MLLDFDLGPTGPHGGPLSAAVQELQSLDRESDTELRSEGLLNLGLRLEAAGNLSAAVEIYSSLVETARGAGREMAERAEGPIRRRARQRLDTLLGRGAVGARTEFLLRRLAQEATDPASLLAMAAGASAFRITRFATLTRLAATPGAGIFTRGLGARALGGLAGLAVEAPVFTLSARGLRHALASGPVPTETSLAAELASSYLTLGALKLSGAGASALIRRLGLGENFSGAVFRQGAILSGLMLGHRLEEGLSLRPRRNGANALVDSLATLLQFHVGGRLSGSLFGPRWSAWEQGLDLRAERLTNRGRPISPPGLTPYGSTLRPVPVGTVGDIRPPILMMSSRDPKSTGPAANRPDSRPPRAETPIRVEDLTMVIRNLRAALSLSRPHLHFAGVQWEDGRDTGAILARLRETIPLPREKTLEVTLLRQRRHLTFYWQGDEIQYRSRIFSDLSELASSHPASTEANTADTLPRIAVAQEAAPKSDAGLYRMRFAPESGESVPPSATRTAQSALVPGTWTEYERRSDQHIEALAREIFPQPISSHPFREESSALRGRNLARIANHVMQLSRGSEDTPTAFLPMEAVLKITIILENAYRHLDFGTVESFRERLLDRNAQHFSQAVEMYNQGARRSGKRSLLRPEEMATEFPGNHLIPRSEGLRSAFLDRLFEGRSGAEHLTLIPEVLPHPQALGRIHAEILRQPLHQFFTDTLYLQTLVSGEPLANLLHPERPFHSQRAQTLQLRILQTLREVPELARLLVGGRGNFHREYLRVLFFDAHEPIRDVYPPFLSIIHTLPPEHSGLDGRQVFLPTLGQIRDFTGVPSRPPRSR